MIKEDLSGVGHIEEEFLEACHQERPRELIRIVVLIRSKSVEVQVVYVPCVHAKQIWWAPLRWNILSGESLRDLIYETEL